MRRGNINRLNFLVVIIVFFAVLFFIRLFYLQIIRHNFYKNQGEERLIRKRILYPKRGLIKDRNFVPLAINLKSYVLYAVPADIKNPQETAKKLMPYLGIKDDEDEKFIELVKKLSQKNSFYKVLQRNISLEKAQEINELNLEGIGLEQQSRRFYPEGNLFGQIIGFLGMKDDYYIGQYGLEEYFNSSLEGKTGFYLAQKAPGNIIIPDSEKILKKAIDGDSLVLTIDRAVQYNICNFLKEGIKKYKAESGTVIVLQPKTGEILALCNFPNFNPNNYSSVKDYRLFKNSAVSDAFEPGSVFKIFTMAAGLDVGGITPETTYEDKGEVRIRNHIIKNSDFKAHGIQTMTNVLEKSLNTGAVYVAFKIGQSVFRSYIQNFGFGSLTGIEQTGEARGDIKNLEKNNKIYLATASFGQGISVTPIQLAVATAAIANQGKLMKPFIVKEIIKSDGETVERNPQFVRQVISPSTASMLTAMMVSVIENGYGKAASVPGYYLAGKTGTAQIPKKGGGYSEKTIHSFVGFGPVPDPSFVVVIKLDNPQKGRFSASTAAPLFKKIAEYLLRYYKIPPNK
ncbi:penicillin-binding protein 2 [bacterium]|nr:penicillin-binding protein 2 [bacterium]